MPTVIKAFPKRPKTGTDGPLEGWLDNIWQLLKSDVYTPTLTNTTNIDDSTAYQCQYIRLGDCAVVSGQVDINATAAGSVVLGVTVPIPSNFTAENQCGGVAFAQAVAGEGVAIKADATNNRATFQYIATSNANRSFWFIFMYRIIG